MAQWTREEAERILTACREADPALFGPAYVRMFGTGDYGISLMGSDDDARRGADIALRAAILADPGGLPHDVRVERGGRTISKRRFDGEEVA